MDSNVQCLRIIRKSSLLEIETYFKESAARDKDKLNWYLGEILDKSILLKLHIWPDNNTLENLLIHYSWRTANIKGKFVDVQRINKMQYLIQQYGDDQSIIDYSRYMNPITIRSIVSKDEEESKINKQDFSFWLEDGLHRSIALGDLLYANKIEFIPIFTYYGTATILENGRIYNFNELTYP